ncbi:MAG: sensor histidine kinase [Alphaproteobacteria bacterium]
MRLSFWTALSSSLVVIGAALVILFVTDSLVRDRLESSVSARLEQQLDKEISLLRARLDGVGNDISAIARGPLLRAWLDAGPDDPSRDVLWQQINRQLATVVATHDHYFQLRFLDTTGHERARVDRKDDDVVVTARADLQDKSDRDYVPPVLALLPGEIYLSALNLNREHGVIDYPLRPTIRLGAPVFDDDGERRGAVLVNLDAARILPPRELDGAHFIMVDEFGAFLRHPIPDQEFGLELASGVTLARDYAEAAAMLGAGQAGTGRLLEGLIGGESELLAFRQILYDPSNPGRHWTVVLTQPQALAFAPIASLRYRLAIVVFGVAMLACAAGWLLAYRVTKPLSHLTRTARRISSGNLDTPIEVRGDGEIAELGAAFKLMTSRLRQMIEDERRANEELGKTNQELERSNQDLADFAHAASHDLRTPLRALRAIPEWIEEDLEGLDLPDEVGRHLHAMQAQGERMENVISSLLEYSRIGRSTAQLQPFDPDATVHRVLDLLAIPQGFEVEVACESRGIAAVQTEWELILRNLIQNAVKHHDHDHGKIRIDGALSGSSFVLEVSDDGPGIPSEYHQRVLLPFHALKRKDEGGGTGLGLALVNKIVQRSGGRLEILSGHGIRGTCFRVILPVGVHDVSVRQARPAAA